MKINLVGRFEGALEKRKINVRYS